jgi:hypothetical protein
MNVRRLILALLCAACALAAVTASAGAVTQFGSHGAGAGQFIGPWGVAVDSASGDVYVADNGGARIEKFSGSGSFLMAWGWGVLNGAAELQTCTTTCRVGLEGTGAGEFANGGGPRGVAVDNDPLSLSYGDVYVASANDGVDKFNSSGELLLTFGEYGTGNSQFTFTGEEGNVIAVGPTGSVYVGNRARVEVFEPSGVWRENISLAGLSSSDEVTSLAVDGSGDVFVKDGGGVFDGGVPGVHEFEPNGTEKATQFDAGSTTVSALAVDESGDLFVGDTAGGFNVLEYAPNGEKLASFGHDATQFAPGMALTSVPGAPLYMSGDNLSESPDVVVTMSVFPVPKPAPPVIELGSVSATGGRRGTATVNARINAEGVATSYRVEYVSEAEFLASGYADASNTPEVSLGSKFEEMPVSVALSELAPAGTYHYRLVATSSMGTTSSPDQTFTTVAPALISGPWVANVTSTSATFAAEINPLGSSTDYRLEYGTSTAYGQTLSGNVGEGEGNVPVSYHRQGLLPGTIYHYRVVVHNEVGVFEGADHTFTTQSTGGQEFSLPDGRAWELVSPPNKKGALLGPLASTSNFDTTQAASDGSGIAYPASEPVGEGETGHTFGAQILATRHAAGWTSQDISVRESLPPEGESATALFGAEEYWHVFSLDLSMGLVEPAVGITRLSPEALGKTLYLRNYSDGAFQPLENTSNVPPGTQSDDNMEFVGATPDLSHVIFSTTLALTPGALGGASGIEPRPNLYDWSAGRLQLVNVLPNGETEQGASFGGGDGNGASGGMTAHAISANGRWAVWSMLKSTPSRGLYVRDMVEGKTFQLGGANARFETMSSDGSKVFFTENEAPEGTKPSRGELHMFDTTTDTQTDLTENHLDGEHSAGVQANLIGASEDGSYVYFIATGVLASGAEGGADNLYVMHEVDGAWTTTYVATLSSDDSNSWRSLPEELESVSRELFRQSSRVSSNGRYVTFMSDRSLTGYDNLDAVSGQPDEEVYVYDAGTNRLVCASCDPTGARPTGILDDRIPDNPLLVDITAAWGKGGSGNHWLAGSIPGWNQVFELASYQPRYLSDSGRLFFDSPDALVPQDIDGVEDVYEYEPAGVGSCSTATSTFSERSQGCVSLISAGTSASESAFMDASESGDDVFFATASKLTREDYDTSYDVYDTHVCSAAVPCRAEVVSPPPCTSGDSCKAAPAPQPEIFGPAPSATFKGTGNVVEEAKKNAVKRKAKPKPKEHPKKRKRRPKEEHGTHSGSAKRKGKR